MNDCHKRDSNSLPRSVVTVMGELPNADECLSHCFGCAVRNGYCFWPVCNGLVLLRSRDATENEGHQRSAGESCQAHRDPCRNIAQQGNSIRQCERDLLELQ